MSFNDYTYNTYTYCILYVHLHIYTCIYSRFNEKYYISDAFDDDGDDDDDSFESEDDSEGGGGVYRSSRYSYTTRSADPWRNVVEEEEEVCIICIIV